MEQNLPVIAKKFWSIMRIALLILKKGISKRKFMLDLNIMIKHGKIARKVLHNLLTFHHHSHQSSTLNRRSFKTQTGDYEFSCSNSPAYLHVLFPFQFTNKRKNHHHSHFFSCAHAPATADDDIVTVNAVIKALEMFNSEAASPALPGFGRSPMVRQLRITDSPFPLREMEEDSHVDEAAEEFIIKFYKQLRQQSTMSPF